MWCDYLEAHTRKVYAAELFPDLEAAHLLAAKIEQGEVSDGMTLRDLYRHHWTGLTTPSQVSSALSALSAAEWVRVESLETGGRPTEILRLHPELRGANDA
jgi:hypothetical protein